MDLHRGNLYLVGLPGSGKSTLGRQLARRLDKLFLDADRELEHALGVSIVITSYSIHYTKLYEIWRPSVNAIAAGPSHGSISAAWYS